MLYKVPDNPSELKELLLHIANLLNSDKVGAIPTETFYALACNPFSEKALLRLFELKKREPSKPILLLLGRLEDLSSVVAYIPGSARKLIKVFWPGPLTIVLPAKSNLPKLLTGGLNTIGVRLSSCELTRKIAQIFGKPVTGTSANISGHAPCRSADEILRVFPDIDFVIDGGTLTAEQPSTVIEISEKETKLIREGIIPWNKIKKILEETNNENSPLW